MPFINFYSGLFEELIQVSLAPWFGQPSVSRPLYSYLQTFLSNECSFFEIYEALPSSEWNSVNVVSSENIPQLSFCLTLPLWCAKLQAFWGLLGSLFWFLIKIPFIKRGQKNGMMWVTGVICRGSMAGTFKVKYINIRIVWRRLPSDTEGITHGI